MLEHSVGFLPNLSLYSIEYVTVSHPELRLLRVSQEKLLDGGRKVGEGSQGIPRSHSEELVVSSYNPSERVAGDAITVFFDRTAGLGR